MPEIEHATLAELEDRISAGLETFVDVGLSLVRIRDERMYRQAGFDRFEDYCRDRWGWGRSYANKTIVAAEVAQLMGTNVPTNEAQARELAPLAKDDPELARQTWDHIRREHGDDVTAEKVRGVVKSLTDSGAWDESDAEAAAEGLVEAARSGSEPAEPVVEHGSRAGFLAHLRRDEQPCASCRAANAVWRGEQRDRLGKCRACDRGRHHECEGQCGCRAVVECPRLREMIGGVAG